MAKLAPTIDTLLIDADGVVQTTTRSFLQDLQALCPEPSNARAFLEDIFRAEKPCLVGAADFPHELTKVLQKWEVDLPISDALKFWRQIEPAANILETIAKLRARGTRVCLASNQQAHRAHIMAIHLNYASLFDELFFSFELGVAKPSSTFFEAILNQLRADAENTLFIDDHEQNVAAAVAIGIHAQMYHVDHGADAFTSLLERYGLVTA